MRVPKDELMDREAYQFFAGLSDDEEPTWTSNVGKRRPVFTDRNGVGWNTSVSYNPGLRRYLLITEHHRSKEGNFGLFDAPEPWGPWTTVAYTSGFGEPHVEASTFFWNFSNKWLSSDGTEFVLVFTGVNSNDAWNTVHGTFHTSSDDDLSVSDPPLNAEAC